MRLCSECEHSVKDAKYLRCGRIEGNPICLNAREPRWNKKNKERECGPAGKLWVEKKSAR